jgi:predicted DNA-binding transcriptional regulator AlpA
MYNRTAITVADLVDELGLSRSKLYTEIKAGRLKPRKIGRKTIFLVDDVRRYLDGLPEQVSESPFAAGKRQGGAA